MFLAIQHAYYKRHVTKLTKQPHSYFIQTNMGWRHASLTQRPNRVHDQAEGLGRAPLANLYPINNRHDIMHDMTTT